LHSKITNMKSRTETILVISKYLALAGAVWYSILFGGHLVTLIASFVSPDWASRTYEADLSLLSIRGHSIGYYVFAMSLTISITALKATIWFVVFDLLSKLRLKSPFSMEVQRKLERIAFLLLGVWIMTGSFWKMFAYYYSNSTGLQAPTIASGDEYLFMACVMYIISQVFKRGIEIQEENQFTV
jgi:hypothetical protein